MSTKAIRDFRPKLHFTAPSMWLNDPNGLVMTGDTYHLFYQHNPNEPIWGSIHWGHAVSKVLLHWTHLPLALHPDEMGHIFSGSAVLDTNNTSGLSANGKAPLAALYTAHHATTGLEQQCLAWSLDQIHFEKYEGNPVIQNPGVADFRDPKVFWNEQMNCWSLVLAAKDRVYFYASPDLKKWEKTGEFGPDGNYVAGVWECPDLFQLTADDGTKKWVLLVSMGRSPEMDGPRVQYFLGDFNGSTFSADGSFHKGEFLDQGFDNYAGVTYSNAPQRTYIGWATNYSYAAQTPTGEFCGSLTLPRKLSLMKTEKDGYQLCQEPLGIANAIEKVRK